MADSPTPSSVTPTDSLPLANGGKSSDNRSTLAPAAPDLVQAERLSLTPRQTLMWLDRKLFPDVPLHHMSMGLRLHGDLDLKRLELALRQVWNSTDCLHLRMDELEPRQWFAASGEMELELADVSGSADKEQAWRAALTCRRFEAGGPLVRAGLARVSAQEHLLLMVFHHVVADGATAVMLANRLASAYQGKNGATPLSYRFFLQLHDEYRASQAASDDAAYWSAKLARGVPPLTFYGRAQVQPSLAVAALPIADAQARLDGLAEVARDPRISLVSPGLSHLIAHATVLVAYAHRATGNKQIVVAAPFANRPGQLGQVPGLTMEELFLKVEVEDGETFLSLGQKLRLEAVSTLRHGRHCVSERGLSFVTLNLLGGSLESFSDLQVEFDLREAFRFEEQLAGLTSTPRNLFGVNLHQLGGQAPTFELTFHAATFDQSLRTRSRGHYLRLMDAMLANLEGPIATVPLTGADERWTLLAFGRGRRPEQPAQDLLTRLDTWAERQPRATAVADGAGDCSYAQLQGRTRKLMASLVALGVGPEKAVCVCLPRSRDELVALLAVLSAGGAYVPIDPSHPIERTRLVLEDAHPTALLTVGALAPRFPGIPCIALDHYDWEPSPADAVQESRVPTGSQLAYVLFTSGSTGRPKGVEVTRGNLSNFLASMARTPGLTRSDRVLAITTTTFDIAALELFLPLYVGGVSEIVDHDTAADPRLLRRILERRDPRVTLLQATPATWRMLLDAGFSPTPPLRLLCGGEALSRDLAEKLTAHGNELWNVYGPTETTVWSALERVHARAERICVGKPIDRTNLYVMGPGLELEPLGVTGEICIGGSGVARGYRGRPDLTAERFLPDPVEGKSERLYRTGDLGRWCDDGRLECLGRLDHQVKVRGFRIELGEIEACLRGLPGVSDVLVAARPAPSGETLLVAYWTGSETSAAVLTERARVHLPAYMHPSAYVHLPAFPLNTNGKIDRKLLPEPDLAGGQQVTLKRPQTPIEEHLLRLWRALLRREAIGVDQSFFDLGGDSVLMVSLAARITAELGVEIPLSRILEEATIERLASSLAVSPRVAPATMPSSLVEIKPGSDKNLFLVHDGDGEALLYRTLAFLLPPAVAVWGIVPRPRQGIHLAYPTLADLAHQYVEEVRQKQGKGPYRIGGLCAGGVIAFEMARQLERIGEVVSPVVLIDATAPGTRMRFALQTRRRLTRLVELLATASTGRIGSMVGRLPVIAGRARNMLDYEAHQVAARSLVLLRRHLMQRTLQNRRVWPSWLTVPDVRERCIELQHGHDPGSVKASRVLLVRALSGDGREVDRPMLEQYDDPLLGWGDRVGSGLEILDIHAGHSTVLQGEGARQLAARLAELL